MSTAGARTDMEAEWDERVWAWEELEVDVMLGVVEDL